MLIKFIKQRQDIRKNIRIIRKSLNITKSYDESIKISNIAFHYNLIYNAKNIAIFLPFDGEINTYPLILKLWLNNNQVFLPIIHSFNKKQLLFARFTSNSILYRNKYNILQPHFNLKDIISTSSLDVVIVPLVAFDRKGVRLGMGGGFYDIFLKDWRKKKLFQLVFLMIFN